MTHAARLAILLSLLATTSNLSAAAPHDPAPAKANGPTTRQTTGLRRWDLGHGRTIRLDVIETPLPDIPNPDGPRPHRGIDYSFVLVDASGAHDLGGQMGFDDDAAVGSGEPSLAVIAATLTRGGVLAHVNWNRGDGPAELVVTAANHHKESHASWTDANESIYYSLKPVAEPRATIRELDDGQLEARLEFANGPTATYRLRDVPEDPEWVWVAPDKPEGRRHWREGSHPLELLRHDLGGDRGTLVLTVSESQPRIFFGEKSWVGDRGRSFIYNVALVTGKRTLSAPILTVDDPKPIGTPGRGDETVLDVAATEDDDTVWVERNAATGQYRAGIARLLIDKPPDSFVSGSQDLFRDPAGAALRTLKVTGRAADGTARLRLTGANDTRVYRLKTATTDPVWVDPAWVKAD